MFGMNRRDKSVPFKGLEEAAFDANYEFTARDRLYGLRENGDIIVFHVIQEPNGERPTRLLYFECVNVKERKLNCREEAKLFPLTNFLNSRFNFIQEYLHQNFEAGKNLESDVPLIKAAFDRMVAALKGGVRKKKKTRRRSEKKTKGIKYI
jgi:hypothetical protein